MLQFDKRIPMGFEKTPSTLPLFDTLPGRVAVLKLTDLQDNPTYSGLVDFLNIDVHDTEPLDMGGRGTIRPRVFESEEGSRYGRYDITFTAPFSSHFHEKSWEVISVQDGDAIIKVGGTVKEWLGGRYMQGGFTQEIHIGPGDVVVIPPNNPQAIELLTESLSTKVLMSPPYDREDSFEFEVH